MLTYTKQANILHDAARACNMDGHICTGSCQTVAEQAMVRFGANENTPRKNSYLYLNSVDACFYIQNDKAFCTFTAKWYVSSKDLDKLDEAGKIIKKMLNETQKLINKED